ncbi:MAG: CPBP family intramembrane metalloprotease [Muribaculaceae bacterium]|nr:CPBP family intramembrane metalloprotease [Muribaculaceae bacterium]MDE6196645.1 CPBP family intramembrane metalloprotease [Muribaculaceae bacterium]
MKKSELVLTLGQRLFLLLCMFLVCYLLTAAAAYVLGRLLADNPAGAVRISAVLQDVVTFIIPAVVTALFVTRRPAELLCLSRKPSVATLLLIAVVLAVSVPAQEAVIYSNYHISLPESMAAFEAIARQLETSAFETLRHLLANTSTGALIVNILIIGVFAGLSEELLFRGCFQRLLTTGGVNPHVAIWIVAFCFSALHFQLFGFVPRMLLGAYFGYLLLWTRSLWAPVAAHVLNNVMFVVTAWHQARTEGIESVSGEPSLWPAWATVASAALTAAAIYLLWKGRVGRDLEK